MAQSNYIHGYSTTEQERLIRQAETLEPFLHKNIDLNNSTKVLEIGCGTGGQLGIMARRFENTKLSPRSE